jgi:hypothetical protein
VTFSSFCFDFTEVETLVFGMFLLLSVILKFIFDFELSFLNLSHLNLNPIPRRTRFGPSRTGSPGMAASRFVRLPFF